MLSNVLLQEELKVDIERLELSSDLSPFTLSLKIKNFQDATSYTKFVKNCERLVRSSLEYKLWRDYLKDILCVNSCAVTNEKIGEVTIDIHHHVPSLYILVSAILNRNISEENYFSTFDICLQVLEEHFINNIGYVSLVSSLHEKFHSGFLAIPIEFVKGHYQNFLEKYSQFIDEEDLEVINQRLNIKLDNCRQYSWSVNNYPGVVGENKNE